MSRNRETYELYDLITLYETFRVNVVTIYQYLSAVDYFEPFENARYLTLLNAIL